MPVANLSPDPARNLKISYTSAPGSFETQGCHAGIVKNVSCAIGAIPKMGAAYGEHRTLEALLLHARSMGLHPSIDTYEKYLELLPPKFSTMKPSEVLGVEDFPEYVTDQIWGETFARAGGKTCGVWIFSPILNNGLPSRVDAGHGYKTAHYIKWLMKTQPGSWYGTPIMRNPLHNPAFGKGISFFQVITWEREYVGGSYPDAGKPQILKGTSFQLHPKGTGEFGPIITLEEFMKQKQTGPGGIKFMEGKTKQEIRDGCFIDLKTYAKSLRSE